MGKFKEYLLTEIKKSVLMKNADKKRIKLSKEMRVRPPKVETLDNGLERMSYKFKMSPPSKSVEGKSHYGYIDYDSKTKDIKKLFCSCKDWAFRLRYPYAKDDLATWDLDKKFKKKEPFEHNQEPTYETNPNFTKFLCKHLFALIKSYL